MKKVLKIAIEGAKKYNVNPSAYYPQFNHEYMANLRAPSSEA